MISVMVERIGSPVPLVKICGTSNNCKPPIRDVITTYTRIGRNNGNVICQNTWEEVAPSTSAASNKEVSIPIIPAIRRIVVLPNHIRQFISAISPLALPALDKNLYGVSINPICISIELIGPPSENNVKNNMENADAMIRFGRYTTVLKKRVPFNLRRTSENHAPSTSDKMICGMKHMIHNNMVFLV